jgi:histone deacetylase complex subunit SAP30
MPPAKSRANDGEKHDHSGGKDKNGGHSSTKMRRITSQQGGAHAREAAAAVTSAPAPPAEVLPPSIQWSTFERQALHSYRREYELETPQSFASTFHQTVMSQSGGIGMYSPTMVRRQKKKRQAKEQLALAVRKHFNGLGVQENDVIVDLIYKIQIQNAQRSPRTNKQFNIITE